MNWTRRKVQSMLAARRPGQQRLAHARHVLDQDVPLGQQGDHHQLDHLGLAQHHRADVVESADRATAAAISRSGAVSSSVCVEHSWEIEVAFARMLGGGSGISGSCGAGDYYIGTSRPRNPTAAPQRPRSGRMRRPSPPSLHASVVGCRSRVAGAARGAIGCRSEERRRGSDGRGPCRVLHGGRPASTSRRGPPAGPAGRPRELRDRGVACRVACLGGGPGPERRGARRARERLDRPPLAPPAGGPPLVLADPARRPDVVHVLHDDVAEAGALLAGLWRSPSSGPSRTSRRPARARGRTPAAAGPWSSAPRRSGGTWSSGLGVPADRVHLIRPGIEPPTVEEAADEADGPDDRLPVIGTMGSFRDGHGSGHAPRRGPPGRRGRPRRRAAGRRDRPRRGRGPPPGRAARDRRPPDLRRPGRPGGGLLAGDRPLLPGDHRRRRSPCRWRSRWRPARPASPPTSRGSPTSSAAASGASSSRRPTRRRSPGP